MLSSLLNFGLCIGAAQQIFAQDKGLWLCPLAPLSGQPLASLLSQSAGACFLELSCFAPLLLALSSLLFDSFGGERLLSGEL